MDAIEIAIYLGIAVVAGGLVIMFIADLSPSDIYKSMHRSFFGDDKLSYKKITPEELASESYRVWEQCGFGAQMKENTIYVTGAGPVDRTRLFQTYRKLNLCSTIQSQSQGCGAREDVNISRPITLPAVVHIRCDVTRKELVLE